MAARRAKGVAKRVENEGGRDKAKRQVEAVKTALGEGGPVWWTYVASDVNRCMAKNTFYPAEVFAHLLGDRKRIRLFAQRLTHAVLSTEWSLPKIAIGL